jgi:hypothetical protein
VRQRLKNATGADSEAFAKEILDQFAKAYCPAKEDGPNVFGIVEAAEALVDMRPNDAVEGMLISRFLAIHKHSMGLLSLMASDIQVPQAVEVYGNMAIKLSRLGNETIDALNKHRRREEQRVIVQHVNVESGGKAVVGNVLAGEGGVENSGVRPHG